MTENRIILDGTIAAGAISLPWWVVHLSGWMSVFTILGGLILVCFRIMLAYRELKSKDQKQDQ
jgi:hypothetical protein